MKKTQKHKSSTKKQGNQTTRRNHLFREKMMKELKTVKLRCSPQTANKKYTCLEDETLYKLKDLWNARHEDSKVESNDAKEIWTQLNGKLKGICNKESCWLKQKFVRQGIAFIFCTSVSQRVE